MSEEQETTTAEAKAVHIDTKKGKRKLRVQMTEAELLEAGDELAQAQSDLSAAEEELKTIKADFKMRTTAIEAKAAKYGNLVRQKYDMRDVDVETVYDYDEGMITVTRLDSDTVVESRPMNDAEKQREMELWPQGNIPSNDANYEAAVSHVEIHDAIKILLETKRASGTAIKRRMGLSERRAWMILDKLEELKVVGPPNGEEPREILMDEVALQRFLEDYPERAEESEVESAKKSIEDHTGETGADEEE